jgi:type 1 fimbria pilin
MKRVLAVAATALFGAALFAAPASAAGQLCYDVNVVVNGQAVVAQTACTPIG